MGLKIIFAGVSSVMGIVCFIPYIRDIFLNKTKPHGYTWFVWTVLQIVAAMAMWSGDCDNCQSGCEDDCDGSSG